MMPFKKNILPLPHFIIYQMCECKQEISTNTELLLKSINKKAGCFSFLACYKEENVIIKTTDVDNYLVERNRNHAWFDMIAEDKSEIIMNTIDDVFLNVSFNISGLDTDAVFEGQSDELKSDFIKAIAMFIDWKLENEDSQIKKLKEAGISSYEDDAVKLTFFSQDGYSELPAKVYKILKKYVLEE
jgi:hypothetical protein